MQHLDYNSMQFQLVNMRCKENGGWFPTYAGVTFISTFQPRTDTMYILGTIDAWIRFLSTADAIG